MGYNHFPSKKALLTVSLLSLSILLLGCTSAPVDTASPVASPTQQAQTQRGQSLPITAIAQMRGQRIELEVAQTPLQQEIGLMFRTELADNRGMLFSFEPARPVQFWMRNTLIPLDMVFLRDGEVKAIIAEVPPCTTPQCPTYGPRALVNQVIELRGGRAAELGLQVGDRVQIEPVETP